MADIENPADALQGLETDDGWLIEEKLPKPRQDSPSPSGGCFSTGYIVRHPDGRRGFLKAMDYTGALSSQDPARALQFLTAMYNFERDVLAACKDRGCSRVVIAISSGRIDVPNARIPVVEYLIFELAQGDVRSQALRSLRSDLPWFIRAIHHTAVGLNQLHIQRIYHQDLKPSNLLVFEDRDAKVSDLGRARSESHPGPHDNLPVAGDRSYAPPELLYGYRLPDPYERSRACDMYHLGSMLHFFVTGTPITPDLISRLRDEHRPGSQWSGSFVNALPYLRDAFAECVLLFEIRLGEQLLPGLGPDWAETVIAALRQLCEPDLRLRGHPKNIGGRSSPQYALERYISLFNRLAAQVEYAARRLSEHAVRQP